MRKMEITEIDSECYSITTTEFENSDSVKYSWDMTTRKFYGEYQYATVDKRQFQREYYEFSDYPTIGAAIAFIWQNNRDITNARWRALVGAARVKNRVADYIHV